jgi:hypothetical protein
MKRRSALVASLLALVAALGGCAGLDTVTSEVATYGDWPAGRQPGRFAFERLPSQQSQPARQAELEASATRALEAAGFTAAPDAAQADVIVQIGARVGRAELSPWDDPLWWRWGAGYWHSPGWGVGYWRGPMWGVGWRGPYYPGAYAYYGSYYYGGYYTRFERSVALLLRDRSSGAPLYEAHALSEGNLSGGSALFTAMFEAALKDFPAKGAANPRLVSVQRAP